MKWAKQMFFIVIVIAITRDVQCNLLEHLAAIAPIGQNNYMNYGNNADIDKSEIRQAKNYNGVEEPFPGYHSTKNIMVIPPKNADVRKYYKSISDLGESEPIIILGQGFGGGYPGNYNPGYGGFGGGHGSGFGGGGFGGGYGGFGGNSPMGGFGGYGAPYKKSSGFFSGSTITNVVAGMALYHMISSFTRRPYTVYNYHTQPEGAKPPEEIKLPANMLTLCDEKINSMCGAGTHSICTTNGTILCVASMAQAVPCEQDKKSALCVNTTVPSTDKQEPVNVPCFTNLTMDVNLMNTPGGVPKPENTNYTYCVTTMAVAGPEYKPCPEGQITTTNDYRSILMKKYDWFLENEGLRRHFVIHNYDNPIQANGEINMPIHVLTKCTENAKKACAPGTLTSCTTFNEIMCVMPTSATVKCDDEKYENATCIKNAIPCLNKEDPLCKNVTETSEEITIDMPCFANITINAPFANFNLSDFNGTLPELATSSYTYHYQYCVITLAIPGPETEVCDTTKKQ